MVETDRVREFCVRRLCEKFLYYAVEKVCVSSADMVEGRLCERGAYERVACERVACEKVVCEQVVCEKVCVFFFQHSFSKKSLVRAST